MKDLFFYALVAGSGISALLTIFCRDLVHSLMALILTFFHVAGLWILAKSAFLGMILIMVYIGAVMVLFLFVVMMVSRKPTAPIRHRGMTLLLGGLIFSELALFILTRQSSQSPVPRSIHQIAHHLYTDPILAFQGVGALLLVAMVGTIVLGQEKKKYKNQNISNQTHRTSILDLRSPEVGEGMSLSDLGIRTERDR